MKRRTDASGVWFYNWDHDGRMVSARKGNKIVRYEYDALGRRVSRMGKFVGATARYTYDGQDVIQDKGIDGNYTYQNGPGIDNKLSAKQGLVINYFVQDHLGSTDALTDNTGAVTSQARYDSFGNPTGNLATRYQFTGREYDSFTSLQYSRARFYDPKLGRFISEDPIGFAGRSINLYQYVGNSPVLRKDPSGLQDALPSDIFWWKYYSQKCGETGIKAACDIEGGDQAGLERMATEAFQRGTGSVSGLRFKVGYAENPYCREAENYGQKVFGGAFPTSIYRQIDFEGSLGQTARNMATPDQTDWAVAAWDWFSSWF